MRHAVLWCCRSVGAVSQAAEPWRSAAAPGNAAEASVPGHHGDPDVRTPIRTGIALGGALVLYACLPTQPCACPPATSDAVVYGTVRTSDGVAVRGAQVFAEHRRPGCEGEARERESSHTRESGEYRVYYRLLTGGPDSCHVARVEAPAGSGLASPAAVPFTVRFGTSRAVDSVRVDFVLPA
jgi:hypothetical protein